MEGCNFTSLVREPCGNRRLAGAGSAGDPENSRGMWNGEPAVDLIEDPLKAGEEWKMSGDVSFERQRHQPMKKSRLRSLKIVFTVFQSSDQQVKFVRVFFLALWERHAVLHVEPLDAAD